MIRALINLYILLIIIDTILSYLPQFKYQRWALYVRRYSNFTLNPVRRLIKRYLPADFPFDISPIVVIVVLKLFEALW